MNGLFIGVPQTYDYFKKIQERINSFILDHCDIKEQKLMELMMENNDINFTMKESL